MNKGIIFVLGAIIGAAAGSGVTYILTKKHYTEQLDGIGDTQIDDHVNALRMTEEELREYYIQQLRDLGVEVLDTAEDDIPDQYEEFIEKYNKRSRVNPIEDDEDEDEEEEEDFAPIEPNPFPYIITSEEFDTNDDFSTATIHYYRKDDTFTDDNYEIITGISDILGRTLEDVKSHATDAVYVRNEAQTCDYEILLFDNSYKRAVEGEDELGDMAD